MLEVGGLSGEPSSVERVGLPLPPPEVGGVRGEGQGLVDPGDDVLASDEIGRSSGGCRILERIPGCSLGGVRSDGHSVFHHPGSYETHAGLDAGGSCLAGELHVRGGHGGRGLDGLGDNGRRGLDRIRVGFGSHIDGSDVLGVDLGDAGHHVPGRLRRDGHDILVGGGDRLLIDHQSLAHRLPVDSPDPPDLLGFDPVSRHVRAVAHNSNFHHIPSLSASILLTISSTGRSVVTSGMPSSLASLTASGSVFSGWTYTTMAGVSG